MGVRWCNRPVAVSEWLSVITVVTLRVCIISTGWSMFCILPIPPTNPRRVIRCGLCWCAAYIRTYGYREQKVRMLMWYVFGPAEDEILPLPLNKLVIQQTGKVMVIMRCTLPELCNTHLWLSDYRLLWLSSSLPVLYFLLASRPDS